jgi:hypothetical protein
MSFDVRPFPGKAERPLVWIFPAERARAAPGRGEVKSRVVQVAVGVVFGAAVGGAVIVPLGDVAGERHVAAGHLQKPAPFDGIVQALGRPQAVFGHSLVIFTRGHGRLDT